MALGFCMATSDLIPAFLKRAPQGCVVLIVRMFTPPKYYRWFMRPAVAWLRNSSIAIRLIDDDDSAG